MNKRTICLKIVKPLRDIYDECLPNFKYLKDEIDEILKHRVEQNNWFYFSRIKMPQSFALKVETGRVPNPANLEDFFACTIVVPTVDQIHKVECLVQESFDCIARRPKKDSYTHKSSFSFEFDDLRLYVKRCPSASGKRQDLDGTVFEVQIKTILQHAWSLATHDLIYKTNTVSWSLERIAYQIKAMLEHAEIAIAEANQLANAAGVKKNNKRVKSLLCLIEQIEMIWSVDQLPNDIKRLAETILEIFSASKLKIKQFGNIIEAEKERIGTLPVDLSPYAFTIQAVVNYDSARFKKIFNQADTRVSLFVHSGMDLPDWMFTPHQRIVFIEF